MAVPMERPSPLCLLNPLKKLRVLNTEMKRIDSSRSTNLKSFVN
jgi:hypothetical protein